MNGVNEYFVEKYSYASSSSVDYETLEVFKLRKRMTEKWVHTQPSNFSLDTDVENFSKRWSKFSSRFSKSNKQNVIQLEPEQKKSQELVNHNMQLLQNLKPVHNLRGHIQKEPVIELPDDSVFNRGEAVPPLKLNSSIEIPTLQLSPTTQDNSDSKVRFPHTTHHRNLKNKIQELKLISSFKNSCAYKEQTACGDQHNVWDQVPWKEALIEKECMKQQGEKDISTSTTTIYEERIVKKNAIKSTKPAANKQEIPTNEHFEKDRNLQIKFDFRQHKRYNNRKKIEEIFNKLNQCKYPFTKAIKSKSVYFDTEDEKVSDDDQIEMLLKEQRELKNLKRMKKYFPDIKIKPRIHDETEEKDFKDTQSPISKVKQKEEINTSSQHNLRGTEYRNVKSLRSLMKKLALKEKRSKVEKPKQPEKLDKIHISEKNECLCSKHKNNVNKFRCKNKRNTFCRYCSEIYIEDVLNREDTKPTNAQNGDAISEDGQNQKINKLESKYTQDRLLLERIKTQELLDEEESRFKKILMHHLIKKEKLRNKLSKFNKRTESKCVQTDELSFLKYLNKSGIK